MKQSLTNSPRAEAMGKLCQVRSGSGLWAVGFQKGSIQIRVFFGEPPKFGGAFLLESIPFSHGSKGKPRGQPKTIFGSPILTHTHSSKAILRPYLSNKGVFSPNDIHGFANASHQTSPCCSGHTIRSLLGPSCMSNQLSSNTMVTPKPSETNLCHKPLVATNCHVWVLFHLPMSDFAFPCWFWRDSLPILRVDSPFFSTIVLFKNRR